MDDSSTGDRYRDPTDHDPIGQCVVCGEPVYPIDEDEKERTGPNAPIMHRGCGW